MQLRLKQPGPAALLLVMAWFLLMCPAKAQWVNDQPVWEYEDDTPTIDIKVRLDLHDITIAWQVANDYHNKRFKPEFLRRESENVAFATGWEASFAPYWVGFNDYLYRYVESKIRTAQRLQAPGTVDLAHQQLRGRMVMVTEALVEKARALTSVLEDDTVIRKWEIFIRRLEYLEETIKELE